MREGERGGGEERGERRERERRAERNGGKGETAKKSERGGRRGGRKEKRENSGGKKREEKRANAREANEEKERGAEGKKERIAEGEGQKGRARKSERTRFCPRFYVTRPLYSLSARFPFHTNEINEAARVRFFVRVPSRACWSERASGWVGRVRATQDRIEKPAGSLCCREIMAARIVNKVIGLRRAADRPKAG